MSSACFGNASTACATQVVAAVASITFLCLGDQLSSQLGYQDRPDSFFLLAGTPSASSAPLVGSVLNNLVLYTHVLSPVLYVSKVAQECCALGGMHVLALCAMCLPAWCQAVCKGATIVLLSEICAALLCFAAVLSIAVGILYGFFIAIICSEHIERRHAYILQRQALTQVRDSGLPAVVFLHLADSVARSALAHVVLASIPTRVLCFLPPSCAIARSSGVSFAMLIMWGCVLQEYFVEDLEENLSPSRKLLPEHEQELVSLGLM